MMIELADGSRLDLSAHPLPEGQPDAILNRGQLARAMAVTEVTITNWMGDGMPVAQQGGNGQAYEFQLSHCYAWRMARDQALAAKRSAGDAAAAQMAMAFINDAESEDLQTGMTPADVKAWAEASLKAGQAAQARGELVRAGQVRAMLETLMVTVRNNITALSDYAEGAFGLTPTQAEQLQAYCDRTLEEMALEIGRENLTTAKISDLGAARQAQERAR